MGSTKKKTGLQGWIDGLSGSTGIESWISFLAKGWLQSRGCNGIRRRRARPQGRSFYLSFPLFPIPFVKRDSLYTSGATSGGQFINGRFRRFRHNDCALFKHTTVP
jgi:hypothetical protein